MTLSCTISPTGITAPTYAQVLSSLQASYLLIFGSTAYVANDSQDGQLMAVFAQAITDNNAATIQAYNAYSPAFAQGTGLSSNVKINGIKRLVSSFSSASVLVTGQAGTTIANGQVSDISSNTWNLPASVVIPIGGSITVLATAQYAGAISAAIGAINTIGTPTAGWQSVSNASIASLGSPVETDSALRIRQAISTAYPAQAVNQAILAAVANVPGVLQSALEENPTGAIDVNGVPAHSISVVVSGGDPTAIATAIASRKTPGTGTYGTTSKIIYTGNIPNTINFYYAIPEVLTATITIHPLNGYTSLIGTAAQQALVNYISSLVIGQAVYLTSAQAACIGSTYHLVSIAFGLNGAAQSLSDVAIPYNGLAAISLTNVALTLV